MLGSTRSIDQPRRRVEHGPQSMIRMYSEDKSGVKLFRANKFFELSATCLNKVLPFGSSKGSSAPSLVSLAAMK